MTVHSISSAEFAKLCTGDRKIDLVDVSTPKEYRELHIESARNIPLNQLDPVCLPQTCGDAAREPLYIVCRSGFRGRQACERLLKAGRSNVINVDGGTLACVEANIPVVRGKRTISVDRQVRLAIGSLVLLGNVAGFVYHPAFFGLSTFMGAGLIFAGITDTCALGMVLARMPWNRCKQPGNSICTY